MSNCVKDLNCFNLSWTSDFWSDSILSVPILSNGKLFGVISAFEKNADFFNLKYQKLFELIAEIAGSLLSRILQKEELNQLKQTLEKHLESKKVALDVAIETVSNQFDELKQHRNSFRVLSLPCGPSVLRGVVRAESWLAPTLPCSFPIYYLVW